MIYSDLTPEQVARVEYLFADSVMDSDPARFDYECNGGEIVGRKPLVLATASTARKSKRMELSARPHESAMPRNINALEMWMGSLARKRARLSVQEVVHE